MKSLSWIALVLTAVCVGVLGAGCGSNNGCCAGCSPPAGACPGDGLGQVTPMSDDAGGADATGEQ
jgi:hypothetical protein